MPNLFRLPLSNGNFALTLGDLEDGVIEIRDASDTLIRKIQTEDYISETILLPDGNLLISSPFPNGNFQIYNPKSGAQISSFSQGGENVSSMQLLNSMFFIAGSGDPSGHLRVVNFLSQRIEKSYDQGGYGVDAIQLLNNGDVALGSCSKKGKIRIMDIDKNLIYKSYPQIKAIETKDELADEIRKLEIDKLIGDNPHFENQKQNTVLK